MTRIAHNRISDEVRLFLVSEKEDHPEYNCQWLSELASDRFECRISQPSVWRILEAAGCLKHPRRHRRLIRSRFEAASPGDLVQMDTSWGYWWGSSKLCVTVLLDDHSRYLLHGKFVEHDTFWHNLTMVRETVERYGVFKVLYTDNASFFKPIRYEKAYGNQPSGQDYESEITRACKEVGIKHLTHKPFQPQSKGKVERLFRFIQERFVSQIKAKWSLEEINAEFREWTLWYNQTHEHRSTGMTPKERFNPQGFSPLPAERNLADIFCRKCTRKVNSCNQFSFEGQVYTIPHEHCMAAFVVSLHVHPDRIRVWYHDQFLGELPRISQA